MNENIINYVEATRKMPLYDYIEYRKLHCGNRIPE